MGLLGCALLRACLGRRLPILLAGALLVPLAFAGQAPAKLVVYGDSISAGYGLAAKEGWVQLLKERLAQRYPGYEVVNASVSGETSSGGLTRLAKVLEVHQPDILVLELGGNDGLRGYPLRNIRQNLEAMIVGAKAAEARVLLVGMVLPPNYGRRYTAAFEAIYASLAEQHGLPFVPQLLDGTATDRRLMQSDGIHPTAEAQPLIMEGIWEVLAPLLAL